MAEQNLVTCTTCQATVPTTEFPGSGWWTVWHQASIRNDAMLDLVFCSPSCIGRWAGVYQLPDLACQLANTKAAYRQERAEHEAYFHDTEAAVAQADERIAELRQALGTVLYYFENHVSPFDCTAEIDAARALLEAAPPTAAPRSEESDA